MSAPVETTACTMPVSIILEMTLPILAMVMAPDRVSTTLQSGVVHHGQRDVQGLAQRAPAEGGLGHPAQQAGERRDLVEVEALEGDEAVLTAVVELPRVVHGASNRRSYPKRRLQ